MGCTASTNIAAVDGLEQAPLKPAAQVRLQRKWQHVSEPPHRQMKFLVVGNGAKDWIDAITNGLESQLLGASSSHHKRSAKDLEQLRFRRDHVDYRICHTGDATTFSMYDDAFFAQHFDVLVFCVSLPGYDKVLTTQNEVLTNQMEATLEQFDFLCNCNEFQKQDVILYFTGLDEFERKLQTSPIEKQEVFHDYGGGKDMQEALLFFGNKFKHRMGYRNSRALFMYLAKTPESSILSFVDATKTIILTGGLVQSGFLKLDCFDSDDDFSLSDLDISNRTGTTATDASPIPSFVSF